MAKRDRTLQRYVLEVIEERLGEGLGDYEEILTAKTDPVLATLWDNRQDVEYGRYKRGIRRRVRRSLAL